MWRHARRLAPLVCALVASGAATPLTHAQGISTGSSLSTRPLSPSKSQTRILSAGAPLAGAYRVGLDVTLAPGVLTYWRSPGDAGIPPEFDFKGSQNLGAAKVLYPAPERIMEDGSTAYGYLTEVLFPILVTPKDPSRPTVLQVSLHYATCDTLCVPAQAEQSIRLSPGDPPGPEAGKILEWTARAPSPLPSKLAPRVSLLRGGDKSLWRAVFAASSEKSDLFVEGADGWYFDSKPAGLGAFDISLAQAPDGATSAIPPVTLTYVEGARAYEAHVSLDAASR